VLASLLLFLVNDVFKGSFSQVTYVISVPEYFRIGVKPLVPGSLSLHCCDW
jgi:hypothetical protein